MMQKAEKENKGRNTAEGKRGLGSRGGGLGGGGSKQTGGRCMFTPKRDTDGRTLQREDRERQGGVFSFLFLSVTKRWLLLLFQFNPAGVVSAGCEKVPTCNVVRYS